MGSMEGKSCLVTGATNGIGRETALGLARMGAEVLVLARDRDRGERLVARLRESSGGKGRLFVADLASLGQVRRVAAEILREVRRLDVLVNNAGAIQMERTLTEDGYETTFAVNHLAPFLLTQLLLDRIRESAPARIVNVASDAHRGGRMEWEDLMGERRYGGFPAYSQSKLANILFTVELARRLEGTGVTANSLHPGVVRTGFGHNARGWLRWGVTVAGPFFLSPQKGARTSLYLATSPEVASVSGRYFAREREQIPSGRARDPEAARRLWEISERLTGTAVAGGSRSAVP